MGIFEHCTALTHVLPLTIALSHQGGGDKLIDIVDISPLTFDSLEGWGGVKIARKIIFRKNRLGYFLYNKKRLQIVKKVCVSTEHCKRSILHVI